MCGQALDHLVVVGRLAIPTAYRATGQSQFFVDDHTFRIEILFDAQSVATRACAARVVE